MANNITSHKKIFVNRISGVAYSDECPNSEVYHRDDVVQDLQRQLNEQKDIADNLRKFMEHDKQEIARLKALSDNQPERIYNDDIKY